MKGDNSVAQPAGAASHKYRIEVPNCVDDMDLSPAAFRIYGRIKRRAGDAGVCDDGTRDLAEHCRMSTGQASQAKRELKDAGLIEIVRRKGRDVIRVVDVWAENFERFAPAAVERSPHEQSVHNMNEVFTTRTERSYIERSVHIMNTPPDPLIRIEEPTKEPTKNTHTPRARGEGEPPAAGGCVPQSKFDKKICVDWATWRKGQPDSGIRSAYAVGRARWLDGTADELIAEWQARTPERIAEEQACPVQQKLPFAYALHVVRSMVNSHARAPGDVIAELDVSDDVRAKLREHFDGAEARAHSPPQAAAG
jgi:DNA-binding MarR family transcriptional regulator